MKHNQTLRRGLGILLSLVMCLSLLPAAALAADPECEHEVPATEEGQEDAVRFRFSTRHSTDYNGNETSETTAYAVYSCANCGEEQKVEATMVEKETTPATCIYGEYTVYGAYCTINGETYDSSDEERYYVQTAPALGHEMTATTKISLPQWSKKDDGSFSLCVSYKCNRCNKTVYLYPECEVKEQPDGSKLYTGTVTNTCTDETVTFTLVVYTVTVDGGCDATTGAGDYKAGDTVTLTAGSRSGYTFSGWTIPDDITISDPNSEEIRFTMPEKNVTVTANWTPITVTFDPNGGTLTGSTTTETEPDGTVDYLSAATREDYTFDGWYTEKTGGEKVLTYVTVFTADTTVYAHWTPAAETKQITEASFAMQGYAIRANAEDIVITSNTEGLSLTGGYFEALGQPYSYLLGTDENGDGEVDAIVTGPLEANTEYILMLKADVNAGYDGSGLTKDHVTLNGDIAAEDCGENKWEASIGCSFVLPVLTEDDNPDAKYTVTVNGSYASATGAGEYEEGDLVTLAAGSRSGYTFSGWTSVDNITFLNAGSADTSFVMPAKAVAVTANWIKDTPVGPIEPVEPIEPIEPVEPDEPDEPDEPVGPVEPVNPFTDVPDGSYYEDAVIWAVSKGITTGTTATTFSPDASCTRAQIVTFLYRAMGE